ncbi:TetR family transcriptional regulator [Alicyclobacillus acidoterrestris]|uniref:TetR/AcrR family transcriptional regulator n=1 Tax=Alicyclobacillus suci TaxID=2816080 RepID=UPI0011943942|nr:TetR/AcrR family transcriptional regulator [Alicyclobacillus suci]GEO25626.1 TetR family transcriptional regulator [Alicyclobacillus acidoterrestris]
MAASEKPHDDAREMQRLNILSGARSVFARKGWSATMADIAEAANVSQGLAYRYFPSKEAIYAELLNRASHLEAFENVRTMDGSAMDKLRYLINELLDINDTHIELFRLSVLTLHDDALPSALRAELEEQAEAFRSLLQSLIAEGQQTGVIAPGNPQQLFVALLAFLNGLCIMGIQGSENAKRHFPDADIVLRILQPPANS